jgi:hypothetical protein
MFEPDSRKEMCIACIRNKADSSYMDSRRLRLHARNFFLGLQSPIYKFQFSDSSGVAKALATFGWAFITAFGQDAYHSLPPQVVQGLPEFIWRKIEKGKVRILIWSC